MSQSAPTQYYLAIALTAFLAVSACNERVSDPRTLLMEFQSAAYGTPLVTYDFRFSANGDQEDSYPKMEGRVTLRRTDESGSSYVARIEGRRYEAEQEEHLLIVRQEARILALDSAERTVWKQSLYGGGAGLLVAGEPALMYPFFDPESLTGEIRAEQIAWEGRDAVAGEACDVVRVAYVDDDEDSRWCIGEDRLPRRMEWLTDRGSRVLEIWNLQITSELDKATLVLEPPPGFVERQRWYGPERGSKVPDWSLKTPNGDTVSLSDLRGQVVVLDFWATWCPPCLTSLRALSELVEELGNRPVKVFAVNAMETGDPIGFLEQQRIDLDEFVEGDEVHGFFAAGSLPSFAVIDGSGRVVGVGVGYFGEGTDRYLRDLIEEAL